MGRIGLRYGVTRGGRIMMEREVKLLLNANAVKRVQVHYAVMSEGYMW